MRKLKYSQAINEALVLSMNKNKRVIVLGLGSDDPKGIFGTTYGLKEKFGKNRVFDVPTAENSLTGISVEWQQKGTDQFYHIKELNSHYLQLNNFSIKLLNGILQVKRVFL